MHEKGPVQSRGQTPSCNPAHAFNARGLYVYQHANVSGMLRRAFTSLPLPSNKKPLEGRRKTAMEVVRIVERVVIAPLMPHPRAPPKEVEIVQCRRRTFPMTPLPR